MQNLVISETILKYCNLYQNKDVCVRKYASGSQNSVTDLASVRSQIKVTGVDENLNKSKYN